MTVAGKTCLLHQWVTHEFRAKLPSTWSTSWAAKRVGWGGWHRDGTGGSSSHTLAAGGWSMQEQQLHAWPGILGR